MKRESRKSGNSDRNALGCFGVAIAISIILNFGYKLVRLINNVLNPASYWQGVCLGFRASLETNDWLLFKLVAPVVAASALLLLGGAVALTVVLALASFKKNKAKVFISYQRAMFDDAIALAEALKASGIEPLIVPFQSDPEHDQLLDKIYALIENADFMICLPGVHPSFVEHEVASAIMLKKSLFIVLPINHSGAPNTAQHSYPALILEQLRATNFKPLIQLLFYLHGNVFSTIRLYLTHTRLPSISRELGFAASIGLHLLAMAFLTFVWFNHQHELEYAIISASNDGYATGITWGILVVGFTAWLTLVISANFTIGGVMAVRNRALAVRQTRRMLKEGTYSYPVLRLLFLPTKGLVELLEPFLQQAPPAYHEVAAQRAIGDDV